MTGLGWLSGAVLLAAGAAIDLFEKADFAYNGESRAALGGCPEPCAYTPPTAAGAVHVLTVIGLVVLSLMVCAAFLRWGYRSLTR